MFQTKQIQELSGKESTLLQAVIVWHPHMGYWESFQANMLTKYLY